MYYKDKFDADHYWGSKGLKADQGFLTCKERFRETNTYVVLKILHRFLAFGSCFSSEHTLCGRSKMWHCFLFSMYLGPSIRRVDSNWWRFGYRNIILLLTSYHLLLFCSFVHSFIHFCSGWDGKNIDVTQKLIASQCKVARLRSRLLRCITQVKITWVSI